MKFFKILPVILFVFGGALLDSCSITQNSTLSGEKDYQTVSAVERPREAWVLRSVLDLKPRMLTIALHKNLWVAYNTKTASFYKGWLGKVDYNGPVYTSAHGPQPTTVGTAYLQEPDDNPWRVMVNGSEITPEINYKGHTILNNQVKLKYELVYQGKKILIEEKPEFFTPEGGQAGLEREFVTSGVPAGANIVLKVYLNSLVKETDYKTNGTFIISDKKEESIEGKTFLALTGSLKLIGNGKTTMAVTLTAKPEKKKEEQKGNNEEIVAALFAKSDCNTCHNRDVKTVGPAYMAIAERYNNSDKTKDALIAKVIKGGAGNWGQIPMTPHPDLKKEDATLMVSYILNLDAEKEKAEAANKLMPKPAYPIAILTLNPVKIDAKTEKAGLSVNIYQFASGLSNFPEVNGEILPVVSGSINALHLDNNDFGNNLKENFLIHANGFLNIKKTTNVVFRLVSDDGSRMFVDNKLVVDNGGNHGLESKDGEIILKAGKHPIRVEYYQAGFGKGLSLQWRPYGSEEFELVPPSIFTYEINDIRKTQDAPVAIKKEEVPGDAAPLTAVHPSFTLSQARPDTFTPKVGGMDFLSDGRLVVSTWDSLGSVFIVDGRQAATPQDIKVKRIAYGLAEPLGLKVVDNEIYIMQKQELTKLVDLNKDEVIDEYQTICNGWKVSANFHEFAFGLVYKEGYFYGTLATAINPGGASTNPQIPDRGKVVKISRRDGSFSLVSSGLRTPNGIGVGVDNEIFIADNQGDWLPANKIVHLQEGVWYGSRSVDFAGTANLKETQPVVWLTQDEIGNSPSQPAKLNVGPYKNQMVYGDVTHGGLKRVFAEKVNGQYQGVVFRFTQGLEAGVNRLVWGPDGELYIGGVGSTGNWGHSGKLSYGLQKLTFNKISTFEMLAVRAKPNGVELEFTEPLKDDVGENPKDYQVRQWWFKPTAEYGGPKLDDQSLTIKSIKVSGDRKKVFLELPGMQAKHVVYIRLNKQTVISNTGKFLWTTEAWYNMNIVPVNEM